MKVVVLYDGDVLAFRAASVIEKRSVEVINIKTGGSRQFANKTEFRKLMEGKKWDENNVVYNTVQVAQPAKDAFPILKNQIEAINDELFADEYKVFISGPDNFRDSLPLPDKYKGNREDSIRPHRLNDCKLYLAKKHPSEVCVGSEADDYLIFRGYEYLAKGYTVIIVTNDKDAGSYPGLHIYDYTKDVPMLKLTPDFGSIWKNSYNKGNGEGFMFYCFQMLNGDGVDHYKPCQLAGVRFADAGAMKVLEGAQTKQEALDRVIEQYKKWYPAAFKYIYWTGKEHKADYMTMLQLYHKCVRMKETANDKLDFIDFTKKQGIKL